MTTINLGRVVGQDGANGEDGRGIISIEKTSTQGLVDIYTITYTDETTSTFEVTNGANGTNGTDGTDGEDGRGIVSILKTATVGLVDTYTITYTDGTTSTFEVTNGESGGGGGGLSTDIKNAILDCFENVVWNTPDGKTYYDALKDLFFPSGRELVSISASFDQGQHIIYPDYDIDTLKQYLTVTALYNDSTTETISNYTLSGTLTVGTSVITVTYDGKTTTFNVTVSERATISYITATYTQGQTVVYPSDSLDSLKNNLVVIATYSDGSTVNVGPDLYTLSGTLTVGTSVITVTHQGKTDTFDVIVSQEATITGISAVYTQGSTVITTASSLNDLKPDLVVTATYSDSSSRVVSDYTLSGTLTVGTSTITVAYEGQTDTFDVTVVEGPNPYTDPTNWNLGKVVQILASSNGKTYDEALTNSSGGKSSIMKLTPAPSTSSFNITFDSNSFDIIPLEFNAEDKFHYNAERKDYYTTSPAAVTNWDTATYPQMALQLRNKSGATMTAQDIENSGIIIEEVQ